MPAAKVNGVEIYYELAGRGKTVVLCHGYTGNHYNWALQIPTLARKYQVIAPDLRGHGLSEAPSTGYSILAFAQDIHALLLHLGIEKCHLIGHSMGGFVALEFTLSYPQMVDALVLMDTRSLGLGNVAGFMELRRRLHRIAQSQGMEAAAEYDAAYNPMTRAFLKRRPEFREVSKQRMVQISVESYVGAGEAILAWGDLTPSLKDIKAPTLVFAGEEDTFIIESCKLITDSIPGARFCLIPGAGHSPQEEAPYVFNRELLGFLEEVDRSSA